MGKTVYLLAPTGQAIVNIGGRTTYNYVGWGIDYLRKSPEQLAGMSYKKHIRKQIRNTDALIIDETSVYVALSRARCLQGLVIENNISAWKLRSIVKLDDDVRSFMMEIGVLGNRNEDESDSDSDSDECRELALND